MTNFEKIKSMNLEELADMLCNIASGEEGGGCKTCIASSLCSFGHNGMKELLESDSERVKIDELIGIH